MGVEATLDVKPARRTQAERSAETRSRLLDAAIECIVEVGYGATTTVEIARRAGLSRGAQMNHYPSKGALMVAALEHMYAEREAEFAAAMSQVRPGPDRLDRAIDMCWSFVCQPEFLAWLELEVAARTDPELRQPMRALDQRFEAMIEAGWRAFFPGDETNVAYKLAPRFTWALLDGLALRRVAGAPAGEAGEVLEGFKLMARLMLGGIIEEER